MISCSYASWLLRNTGRRVRLSSDPGAIADPPMAPQVLEPLKKIWAIMDFPCGRRLKAILPKIIPKLEAFGEIELEPETRELLMRISGVDGRKDPVDGGDPCEEQGSGLGL